MSATTVVVINGRARSGKDTVVSFLSTILAEAGVSSQAFSSIDPVRNLLTNAGFDLTQKTEADRKLLAEMGFLVEEHSNWRSNAVKDFINEAHFRSRDPLVVFIHMREPAMIQKLRDSYKPATGIKFLTLFVERDVELVTSNEADANVHGMTYNLTIENKGTRGQLWDACEKVARTIMPRG